MQRPISIFLLALPLAFLCNCQQSRINVDEELSKVKSRSKGVVAAESAKDTEKAVSFYAKDAVIQYAGGPQIQGLDTLRDLYQQMFSTPGFKSFSGKTTNMFISQSGDLAYEIGVNRVIMEGSDGDLLDKGKYLAVWKKIDNNWYIVALSFTSDTAQPVPIQE